MKKNKKCKWTIKHAILAAMVYISVICWLLPTYITCLFESRGYFTIGGEWALILTIPIVLGWVYEMHVTAVKEAREEAIKDFSTKATSRRMVDVRIDGAVHRD